MTHHPAPYSEEIILLHKELLRGRKVRALDPFAGVGRGLDFVPSGSSVTLVEIEPEWADVCRAAAERRQDLKVTVVQGDSRTSIPRRKYTHIFTSPTYGNRFTDPYLPNPKWRRRSYAQSLKRPVSDGATSRFGFHTEQYRNLNAEVMERAVGRLEDGGEAWINVSDFYRTTNKGEEPTRMLVTLWWVNLMHDLGLVLREAHPVYTRRFKDGENRHRAAYESLLIFVKEEL